MRSTRIVHHTVFASASLLLSAGVALAAPANLALAPSFEEGIYGWGGYPSFPIERSNAFAHSGKYSLKLPQGEAIANEATPGRYWVSGMDTIPYRAQPGGRYRCSIFARADEKSGKACTVSMNVSTFIYNYQKPSRTVTVPADGEWHEVTLDVALPDYAEFIAVHVGVTGGAWLDDFSIVETAAPAKKPVEVTLSSPLYFTRKQPVIVTATIRNNQATPATIAVTGEARLPGVAIPEAKPLGEYGPVYKKWTATTVTLAAGATTTQTFTIEAGKLPETGVKVDITATPEGGVPVAVGTREVFVCERPDWKTWFSVGAQCYTSNRFNGDWVKNLKELGGDSVRECIPLPMSYRHAAPNTFTDYPIEARLDYTTRLGLKWLTAYHTVVNNGAAWVAENPANRITRYDGTPLDRPTLCYNATGARAAMLRDAELTAKQIDACPAIFGVQVDNEINAMDCYCTDSQNSFRRYLQTEFGTIASVNAAWGTSYRSFADVNIPPPLFTSYLFDSSGQLDAPQPEKRNAARDFAWLKWREGAFIGYYRDWSAHFKKVAPNMPITDNFSLYVSTLPRFYYAAPVNLFRFAEFFDVGGVDTGPSYGLDPQYDAYQFDWVNSAWGDKPVWVPEIYYDWQKAQDHAVGFDLFYGMGRKVSHTNLFTWPVLADKWGGPYADELKRERGYMLDNVKNDIAQARAFNAKVPVSSLHYVAPSVGIFWSGDIHNFALAMRGPDWLAGTDPLYDLDKTFTDLHYPVQFVDEKKIAATNPASVRALFVGGAHSLSRATWRSMVAYANNGGTLVLNGPTGNYDEKMQPYGSAGCAETSTLGISLSGWTGGGIELFSPGASQWVKLGKGRKVRGFGRYSRAQISAAWQTLLADAAGKPVVVTRPLGKGRIVWSLTDIANPYANYQTSNTLFFVEGLLESAGIGRPVRVFDAASGAAAPKVTVAVNKRAAGETYAFVNNFGDDGTFRFYVNAPVDGLAITEMISGRKLTVTRDKGCGVVTAQVPKCGYAVLRIASAPVDLTKLPVRPLQSAPAAMAVKSSGVSLPAPTVASLTESKTTAGAPLFWLSSPTVRAAISPAKGGRISFLAAPNGDPNNVIAPVGIFPPDGIVSGQAGGIKAVLDPEARPYPGLTMDSSFTVIGKTATADVSSVSMRCAVPAEKLQIDQTVSVSKSVPGAHIKVRQQTTDGPRKLRLYLHANMLLNGEVKRDVAFVAGNDRQSVSFPYKMGVQVSRPAGIAAKWGAVVDAEKHTAVLCTLDSGYTQVAFWNGMQDYNLEAGSDVATVTTTAPQDGEVTYYALTEMRRLNFVNNGIAGYFNSFPEAGGQSIAIAACSLTGDRTLDLVIVGVNVSTGQEKELGSATVAIRPVVGVERNLSLGGAGGGYDIYRLCVRNGGKLIVLKEIDTRNAPPAADTVVVSPSTEVAAWTGGADVLAGPKRVPSATGWALEKGTVRVRFKTSAARDIVHNGVDLANGYHGAADYHQNRKSRLWLNIHGLASWSPVSPMIFFMLFDKDGNRIHATANATLRDDTWYEITAVWDTKAKSTALYLDGQPLKLGEMVFPDNWTGCETIDAVDIGGKDVTLGAGKVLAATSVVKREE
ncbi:MAG TPA: beta-galactosidase [Capsulimonadaceae bacterium]|jgi:hypothetical protein